MQRVGFRVVLFFAVLFAHPAAAAEPVFLGPAEAREAIVDESVEKYFSRLQPMEMEALTGRPLNAIDLELLRAETRQRFQQGVLEFSETEKDLIRWYVKTFQPKLQRAYPQLAKTPWRFIKVASNIEGGLPHTRGQNIILSQDAVNALLGLKMTENRLNALIGACATLVHELVHVHQRLQPERYAILYREEWGFTKADHIKVTAWMRRHQLMNPDGTDVTWIYPIRDGVAVRWILPLVVLSDGDGPKKMPGDMRLIAVTLQGEAGRFRVIGGGDGGDSMKPLTAETTYIQRFPGVHSNYHPNEIAAELVSTSFALDELFPKQQISAQARDATAQMFADERRLFRRFYRETSSVSARPSRSR